jgi:hypothetical protein
MWDLNSHYLDAINYMMKPIYDQIIQDSLIYGTCVYQILDKPPYLQNVTKSEHHVYNIPTSVAGRVEIAEELLREGIITTADEYFDILNSGKLPVGASSPAPKMSRAETWDSLFNPDFKKRVMGEFKTECDHKWQNYTGYAESYEFCSLCDQKKPHNT